MKLLHLMGSVKFDSLVVSCDFHHHQESERGHEKSRKRKRDEYSFDDAEGDVSSSEDGAQEGRCPSIGSDLLVFAHR